MIFCILAVLAQVVVCLPLVQQVPGSKFSTSGLGRVEMYTF